MLVPASHIMEDGGGCGGVKKELWLVEAIYRLLLLF
jgi:hypothetical protein